MKHVLSQKHICPILRQAMDIIAVVVNLSKHIEEELLFQGQPWKNGGNKKEVMGTVPKNIRP